MIPISFPFNVAINKLRRSKLNLRGGDVAVDDLLESFDHVPQLRNIVVRGIPGTKFYEVILGWRLVAAARQKTWSHVTAAEVEVDDDHALLLWLEENLRRQPLPDEPAAMASLKALYEKYGARKRGGDRKSEAFRESNGRDGHLIASATKIGQLAGKSDRAVRRLLAIAEKASPAAQGALADGRITQNEAESLVSDNRPHKEQDRELANLLAARIAPSNASSNASKAERQARLSMDVVVRFLRGAPMSMEVAADFRKLLRDAEGALDEMEARIQGPARMRITNRANGARATKEKR